MSYGTIRDDFFVKPTESASGTLLIGFTHKESKQNVIVKIWTNLNSMSPGLNYELKVYHQIQEKILNKYPYAPFVKLITTSQVGQESFLKRIYDLMIPEQRIHIDIIKQNLKYMGRQDSTSYSQKHQRDSPEVSFNYIVTLKCVCPTFKQLLDEGTKKDQLKYFYQIVKGISYMLNKQINHGDLHDGNILIDLQNQKANIYDFDRSYSTSLGNNPLLDKDNGFFSSADYSENIHKPYPRDLYKICCYILRSRSRYRNDLLKACGIRNIPGLQDLYRQLENCWFNNYKLTTALTVQPYIDIIGNDIQKILGHYEQVLKDQNLWGKDLEILSYEKKPDRKQEDAKLQLEINNVEQKYGKQNVVKIDSKNCVVIPTRRVLPVRKGLNKKEQFRRNLAQENMQEEEEKKEKDELNRMTEILKRRIKMIELREQERKEDIQQRANRLVAMREVAQADYKSVGSNTPHSKRIKTCLKKFVEGINFVLTKLFYDKPQEQTSVPLTPMSPPSKSPESSRFRFDGEVIVENPRHIIKPERDERDESEVGMSPIGTYFENSGLSVPSPVYIGPDKEDLSSVDYVYMFDTDFLIVYL